MNADLVNDLINSAKVYQSKEEISLIEKAIDFSKQAHKQQFRKSGEPYFHHPIEVAKILKEIKLDNSSIACGLLHDTVEDTTATIKEIENHFGLEIASLVDGLTKINKLPVHLMQLIHKQYKIQNNIPF